MNDGAQGYGYQIWMGRHNSYRAIGCQNQLIMVIPEYDFIFVCHSQIMDEAGFYNLIYNMLPSMSDKELKVNKSFDLNAEIAGYEIKRPFEGASTSRVMMSTRRYQMEENAPGIRFILFRFDASGNCYVTFITAGSINNLPFGLNRWLTDMTNRTLSFGGIVYANAMEVTPLRTAGICTWTADNQLSAYYLSMFNPGSTETFRFTFEGEQFRIKILVPTRRRMGPPGMQQPKHENLIFTGTKMKD